MRFFTMIRLPFIAFLILCLLGLAQVGLGKEQKKPLPIDLDTTQLDLKQNRTNDFEQVVLNLTTINKDILNHKGEKATRADIRCQFQEQGPRGKKFFAYKVFVAPYEADLPNWCRKLESALRVNCRDKDGHVLDDGKIKFKRCDLQSTDVRSGLEGRMAYWEIHHKNKPHKRWGGDVANKQCSENAITFATPGVIYEWMNGKGCVKMPKKDGMLQHG